MYIENKTNKIGKSEYYFRTDIEEIVVSNDINIIDDWAFGYCVNLKKIVIPKSVTFISKNAFDGCEKLENIDVAEDNDIYTSENGILYSKDHSVLLRFPSNHVDIEVDIDYSVCKIGDLAFNRCRKLKKVVIPDSVLEIGEKAFAYCEKLIQIFLPPTIKKIGAYAFSDCYALQSLLCNGEKYMAEDDVLYEVDDKKKKLIQYPLARKQVEYKIGSDIDSISDRAFSGAYILEDIVVTGNEHYFSKDGILYDKFKKQLVCVPSSKKIDTLIIPDQIVAIGNSSIKLNCNIKKIVFPSQLVKIERHAVEYCLYLKHIQFAGKKLKQIEWSAFYGCQSLKEVDLSNQEGIVIEGLAFADCVELSRVNLPLKYHIGRGVFRNCIRLQI